MFKPAFILFATLFGASAYAEDPGACCLTDPDTGASYCVEVTFDECESAGGSHYGEGTDCADDFVECDTAEPELGACCVDGTCIDNVTYEDCKNDLGDWYLGTDCGALDAECEITDPDLGACCVDLNADGILECVDAVTNDWCSHNYGTWYAGMDCLVVDAECEVGEPDLGACCREDTCIDNVTLSECEDVGTWYYDSTCVDIEAECGVVADELGACCLKDECIEITAEECWADEGSFYGPNTSCDDVFVECCDGDTTTTEPTDPPVATEDKFISVSCSSSGRYRGGFGLLLPLGLAGLAAGFRRREMN